MCVVHRWEGCESWILEDTVVVATAPRFAAGPVQGVVLLLAGTDPSFKAVLPRPESSLAPRKQPKARL